MRFVMRLILMVVIGVAAGVVNTFGADATFRPDVVIIKLKPQSAKTASQARAPQMTGLGSLDQLNARHGARDFHAVVPSLAQKTSPRDIHGLGQYYIVDLAPGSDVLKAVSEYAADPNVEIAEPDYLMDMDMIPNDPDYGDQWTHFHPFNKDIDTQQGWDLEVGDSTVVVAIIDSGIKHAHPDLKAAIWVNPGEDLDGDGAVWDVGDVDSTDNDGNGYVDDLIGYDMMPLQGGCNPSEDCNGMDNNPDDYMGHGTHVSGIVGAVTDNLTGVAGVAGGQRGARRPGVKLMGLRAGYLGNDGLGHLVSSAIAASIDYAVDNGASVINCSFGGGSGSVTRPAFLNAVASGIVVCKSAGNDTSNVPDEIDSTFGILAVASLNSDGERSAFSNYGTWVDISAPGGSIVSTYSNFGVPDYAFLSGTSMAAPTVAGVAALLKSHHPWFTKTQIDTLLTNYAVSTDPENPLYVGLLGSGRVNAYNSLSILTTADFTIDAGFGSATQTVNSTGTGFGWAPLTVNFTNASPNAPSGPYNYTFGDGDSQAAADAAHIYDEPGIYTVTYTGNGPSGPHTRIRPNLVVVVRDTIDYGNLALSFGTPGFFEIRVRTSHAMTEITLPIKLNGTSDVIIDSCIRTSATTGWDVTRPYIAIDQQSAVYRMRQLTAGVELPAGDHVIANLWVHAATATNGAVETIDSATLGPSQYGLRLLSEFADFKPRFSAGQIDITTPCDCPCQGDPDCNGILDVLDVIGVVQVAFRGSPAFDDPNCHGVGRADMNCSGAIDVLDVVAIVGKAFRGDTTPQCDPCG